MKADAINPRRVAFSPKEFAAMFGKSQTWGYRQIYAGSVKAISDRGRIMIPALEVESILSRASRYEGKPAIQKPEREKLRKLTPAQQNAWQVFFRARRAGESSQSTATPKRAPQGWKLGLRSAALARLTNRKA